MVTQFVNNGTDLETLNKSYESMPLEQQEELAKALKKDGLVLVDVQVNGKHGTYTRKQWKKASDVKKNEGKSSKGAPDADKQKAVPQVIKGKHMSDLRDNLKEHGLVLDSVHNNGIHDDEEVTMYDKDKNTYTAKANVYSDGGVELRKITKEKKQNNTKTGSKPTKKASAPSKAKQDSSSTVSVPKTKADIQSMLASGKSRNDIIELAKKSGISWKENGHEGINWMRCCMALTKASK